MARFKGLVSLGGNFVRAIPEREAIERRGANRPYRLIATKLNRSHLVHGRGAFILSVSGALGRGCPGKRSASVSIEDSFSHIHGSIGTARAGERAFALRAGDRDRHRESDAAGAIRNGAGTNGPAITPSSAISSPRLIRRSSTISTRACSSLAAFIAAMRRMSASGRPKAAKRSSPLRE